MIAETMIARISARCKQAYHWRDNISLIIGLQSASWWSVDICCANYWPTIGAPIIVPPILARLSAVFLNSANPTWVQFFKSTVTAESCKDLLETKFFPYAKKRGLVKNFYLMQDGAAPHRTQEVFEALHIKLMILESSVSGTLNSPEGD